MVAQARRHEYGMGDPHYRFLVQRAGHQGSGRIRNAWGKRDLSRQVSAFAPYTREDRLLDQLGNLPSKEQVHIVFHALRPKEILDIAEGMVNDVVSATKSHDCLEVAKSVNEWIATAEETAHFRRKRRYILAARARQRRERDNSE